MGMLKPAVYLLCLGASIACLVLLARSYARTHTRLLLWSAFSFVALSLNNLLLFIDVIILPTQVDLVPLRQLTSLAAVSVLLYGFVWESD